MRGTQQIIRQQVAVEPVEVRFAEVTITRRIARIVLAAALVGGFTGAVVGGFLAPPRWGPAGQRGWSEDRLSECFAETLLSCRRLLSSGSELSEGPREGLRERAETRLVEAHLLARDAFVREAIERLWILIQVAAGRERAEGERLALFTPTSLPVGAFLARVVKGEVALESALIEELDLLARAMARELEAARR